MVPVCLPGEQQDTSSVGSPVASRGCWWGEMGKGAIALPRKGARAWRFPLCNPVATLAQNLFERDSITPSDGLSDNVPPSVKLPFLEAHTEKSERPRAP